MTNLTDYVPKTLLPVANIPLFWYPLNALARSGFTQAILVVSPECKAEVEKRLCTPNSLPGLQTLKIEVVTVSPEGKGQAQTGGGDGTDSDGLDAAEDECGTADVLRYLLQHGQLVSVVIGCVCGGEYIH